MVHFPFQKTLTYFIRKLTYRSDGWRFLPYFKKLYICEEYTKYYLPVDITGMTVLDVGAGCGESARFFLEHGAKKVICIESDDDCYKCLVENAKSKPIECHHKSFSLSDLYLDYDFIKMDIEGAEKLLLELPAKINKPIVMEVHGEELAKQFQKHGYTLVLLPNNDVARNGWLCYAY